MTDLQTNQQTSQQTDKRIEKGYLHLFQTQGLPPPIETKIKVQAKSLAEDTWQTRSSFLNKPLHSYGTRNF